MTILQTITRSIKACDESIAKVRPHNRMDIEYRYQMAKEGYELAFEGAGDPANSVEVLKVMAAAQAHLKAGHELYWDIPGTFDPRLDAVTYQPWSIERSRAHFARLRGEAVTIPETHILQHGEVA